MSKEELTEALKKYFGHDSFRRPQDEIISQIAGGRDTLAIMPTGGGKSLCYQLPAVLLDGVTIVVSPLIALMKDQVDALRARGIAADMINSSQTWPQQREVLDSISRGELKLAYVAPERFRAASFMSAMRSVKIGLFAVDEAHCISQWGHDFRPDYMRLGETLDLLGRPPCAAFTATATPEVKEDIIAQLKLRDPAVFVSGFARPNLSFNVMQAGSKAEKFARIKELIEEYKTGIVYCATRKSVEAVSEELWKDGIRHIVYHGALTTSERDAAQDAFIGGKENVAIATNAFGMGIDRSDIRFVCHYELTGSIEALYQESGRAGRDGQPSYCEMLLMYADKRVQEFFIDGANPEEDFVRRVYRVVRENADNSYECTMSIDDIAEGVADIERYEGGGSSKRRGGFGAKRSSASVNTMAVSSALSILRRFGYVERYDIAGSRTRGTRLPNPDADEFSIAFPEGMLSEKRRRDERKLQAVLRYAYAKECRQQWILKYFGEANPAPCGRCDVCRSGGISAPSGVETVSGDELTEVRKALSGVGRMSYHEGRRYWRPRFGRDRIQKCLAGSRDEKIVSFGLDKLSTYGILKPHGTKFISELFSAMIEAGLVEIVDGEYPLAGLTDKGIGAMLGDVSEVEMRYPREFSKLEKKKNVAKKAKSGGDIEFSQPADKELFEALYKLRTKICMQHGRIPTYLVFPNSALRAMAAMRPSTKEEAMEIKGIGEKNAAKYLAPFLELIAKYADE